MSTLNENLYVAAGLETEEQALRPLKTLEKFERDYIEMVVFICQGNIPKAAKILDISPSTLFGAISNILTPFDVFFNH